MWTKIQYIILYSWIKTHAWLPMRVLYLFADILYVLIYKVARYRISVVRRGMKDSFPMKSDHELRRMERAFYHHFADYIMETIKLAHISLEEVHRRANLRNPEVIDQLIAEGHTCCLLVMGHYGNWEWFTSSNLRFKEAHLYQIYRPLNNKAFDQLFIYLRTRFGARGVKKNDTIRDIIRLKQEKTPAVVVFLADQTPSPANLHYWTTFLNQETSILNGPERIAQKLDLPVVYMDTRQVKRGYYTVDAKIITKTPRLTPEFWITEQYTRLMEETILRNPSYWLWTHKRWKYKKKQNNEEGTNDKK
ncbi:MAG: lysophospholipid acyltransferase family protein [Tannerellaceae bacterium]